MSLSSSNLFFICFFVCQPLPDGWNELGDRRGSPQDIQPSWPSKDFVIMMMIMMMVVKTMVVMVTKFLHGDVSQGARWWWTAVLLCQTPQSLTSLFNKHYQQHFCKDYNQPHYQYIKHHQYQCQNNHHRYHHEDQHGAFWHHYWLLSDYHHQKHHHPLIID